MDLVNLQTLRKMDFSCCLGLSGLLPSPTFINVRYRGSHGWPVAPQSSLGLIDPFVRPLPFVLIRLFRFFGPAWTNRPDPSCFSRSPFTWLQMSNQVPPHLKKIMLHPLDRFFPNFECSNVNTDASPRSSIPIKRLGFFSKACFSFVAFPFLLVVVSFKVTRGFILCWWCRIYSFCDLIGHFLSRALSFFVVVRVVGVGVLF